MPIFYQTKEIFIWIPKSGGTALVHHRGDWWEGGHHPWWWYEENYPEEWATFDRFAIVRDPVERLRSTYFSARMKKSWWFPGDDLHPDYELCHALSLEEIVQDDEVWDSLTTPAWAQQTHWTGVPSRVEIRRWRPEPMKPMNVTVVDDVAAGALSPAGIEAVRWRFADDYAEFGFD